MNIDWKILGKKALIVAVAGVALTTAILIVRHVKKRREEKKDEEKQVENNKEVNQDVNSKLTDIVYENDLKRTSHEIEKVD